MRKPDDRTGAPSSHARQVVSSMIAIRVNEAPAAMMVA
jgi:hypothetical protein